MTETVDGMNSSGLFRGVIESKKRAVVGSNLN
jgi:hypothetical protein